MPDIPSPAPRLGIPALAMLLAGLALWVYLPANGNGLCSVDDLLHVANPHVRGGLSLENVLWALRPNPDTIWHPLTWLSYMADATLAGPEPGVFHTTNILLHTASVALFFLLLNAATRSPWPSALAAALLAVHPVHVESVAWIAERKDVLSLLLLLVSVAAYGRYARRPSPGRYALLAASFALALMAKPSTASQPLLLLTLDFWPLGRMSRDDLLHPAAAWPTLRPLILEKLPLLAMAAAAYWMNTAFGSTPSHIQTADAIPPGLRLANALVSIWAYLADLLRPTDLAVFYPFPSAVEGWKALLAGAALLAGLALALLASRDKAWRLAGPAWFLAALLPMLGLFQHGFLPARADRYTYAPFLGLYALLAFETWSLARASRTVRAAWFAAALAAVALLVPRTSEQIALWSDSPALLRHAEHAAPGNWPAATFLGRTLAAQGRHGEATEAFRRALAIRPNYGAALVGLAISLQAMGQSDQALEYMRLAVRLNPDHPMGYNQLGLFLLDRGDLDGAEENLRASLRLDPTLADSHADLGRLLLLRKDPAAAAREFRTALEINPNWSGSHLGLGTALLESGDAAAALEEFQREQPLSPDNAGLYATWGAALARLGRLDDALPLLAKASQLAPNSAENWNNLGVTLARLGRLDDAEQSLQKALDLDPAFERARASLEKVRKQKAHQ